MDDPSQWREAIDPSTGSAYYYHRKTRETTWIRPACLDPPVQQPEPEPDSTPTSVKFRSGPAQEIEEEDVEEDVVVAVESMSGGRDYVAYILSLCRSTSADELLEEDVGLLEKLVSIAAMSRHDESDMRCGALRSLWLLSLGARAPRTAFHTNQSWATLAEFVRRWGEHCDYEASILYCCMLSLLLGGAAGAVIGKETISMLTPWVKTMLDKNVFLVDMDREVDEQEETGMSLLDGRVLQALSRCTSGQSLSGLVLLVLAKQAFNSEKAAVHFIRMGGLSAIQALCINSWVPAPVCAQARSVLESALSSSSFVRSSVLTSFLSIAKTINSVALPSGRDPLCKCSGFTETQGDFGEEDDEDIEDVNNEAFELWKDSTLPLQRDVDWKPRRGTSWHVSSVVLWTQCPELRETIEGLWEEAGGELELGTNTSEAALASAVKFLHTGILFPPPSHEERIDLLKLASELGANALVKEASDAILHQMSSADVDSALEISRSLGLGELERAVTTFRSTGKRPHISFVSDVADLRQAIATSMREVNQTVLVQQGPGSASRLTPPASAAPPLQSFYGQPQGDDEYSNIFTDVTEHFRGTPSSKIKSGGIYGLLLEATGKGTQQHQQLAIGSRQQPAMVPQGNGKRVPGRVPEPRSSRTAFGSSASQKRPSNESGASSAATGRGPPGAASNAAAGKRAKQQQQQRQRQAREAAINNSNTSWMEEESGLFEFDTRMSLAPEREPSKREKRLAALANPKSQQSPPQRSEVDDDAAVAWGPKRAHSPTGQGGSGRGVGHRAPIEAEDEANSYSSAVPLVPLDPNVRSSLVLLKARSRRRRPAADIENDLEPPTQTRTSTTDLYDASDATPVKSAVDQRRLSVPRRVLVSCTKRQGCTCEDCLSSASVSMSSVARPVAVRNSSEVVQTRTAYDATDDIEEDEEEEGEEYVVPTFKPEPVHVPSSSASSWLPSKSASQQQNGDFDDGATNAELHECPDCSRRFRPEALARHVGICKKVFMQKRRPFDSKKMRLVDGDGISSSSSSSMARGARSSSTPSVRSWKEQSSQFREAMRSAREYSSALANGEAPPPVAPETKPSNWISCPSCLRTFNPQAGERHIPLCRNIKAKPQALKRSHSGGLR